MHPLWQLCQVVIINGLCRIDRCACFGSRGSPDLWITFIALILWIAIRVKFILDLLAYVDDNFSQDPSPQLLYYEPYQTFYPPKQTRLLHLWDELGIQHQKEKQVFGRELTIIGFHIDATQMTITLPPESKSDLVAHIRSFVNDAPHCQRSLRQWRQMLGWINWGLNVQPLLKPALLSAYSKISSKLIDNAPIYINRRICRDFNWIADVFNHSDGIHIIRAHAWSPNDADLTIYTDACLTGLAFYVPSSSLTFIAEIPQASSTHLQNNIFWLEALTVLAALEYAASLPLPPLHLAIYCDNLDTVQIFDSFKVSDPFNFILLNAAEVLITSKVDLYVWHVPGVHNPVTDALFCGLFNVARQYVPFLQIHSFIPP
ncbi:hypothetical protein C8Q75DRAFT_857878, partial [Abortiporus biennis]